MTAASETLATERRHGSVAERTEPPPGAPALLSALRSALEEATHLLPSQAPIRIFVHHNTLHAFEHLTFDQAVRSAAEVYGTEPYESEEAFRRHLDRGRIRPCDIDAVLDEERDATNDPVVSDGPTVREFRRLRLAHLFDVPRGPALEWLLDETDALAQLHPDAPEASRRRLTEREVPVAGARPQEARSLRAIFERLQANAPPVVACETPVRPRDALLARYSVDTDQMVHPLMIRTCAAFVDQGIAYWPMPGRALGLLGAFRALYGLGAGPPEPWLRGLPERLRTQEREGWDAERTILESLRALGVTPARYEAMLTQTLLSLRGWAGMIRQLEERPDRAPVEAPPARLVDYVAVQLLLDVEAARHVLERETSGELALHELDRVDAVSPRRANAELVYEAFVMAQIAGVHAGLLEDDADARAWLAETQRFDSVERRRLLHRAYERRHRVGILDALLVHTKLGRAARPRARMQAIFCIDDREESLRRHLEEVFPDAETFGYAGFFGVAMAYQGLEDVRPTPLCPVVLRPRHLVTEVAADADAGANAEARRRALGAVQHATGVSSRTLLRGSVVSTALGLASVLPLVGRTLFPRLSERLSHAMSSHAMARPRTRLVIERDDGIPAREDGLLPGFTTTEMADIVQAALRTLALNGRLAPLVLVVGHGSSSLNNPHESAHDCGATGGGRGGPNARAFAAMANHAEVRRELERRGLAIPEGTWFLGGYHNTCDGAVTYFDEDLVPESLRDEVLAARTAMERARRLDAHERCRRFESAPLSLGVEDALAHAEAHAVDLGQPRPEYGHCTNAVCIVGRRELTRGLFLDRRAFLVTYDPTTDGDGKVLEALLNAVGPVGAGINLEYYFSFVDPVGYGCGTKLPHNIVGLVGVMDGHASDLRTGLPWQMVEIHEPVRLLTIVEAEPETLERIASQNAGLGTLIGNHWIQVVAWSPSTGQMSVFGPRGFVPYEPESSDLPIAATSVDYYRGHRQHLDCARIRAGVTPAEVS